jgi:hypothetical protein
MALVTRADIVQCGPPAACYGNRGWSTTMIGAGWSPLRASTPQPNLCSGTAAVPPQEGIAYRVDGHRRYAVLVVNPGVRVRFAPSPTGMFHVGNARSVLFNWVLARQTGGTMVLRIEDTDAARNRPEWIQGILDTMAWHGIGPAEYEGPLFQSDYVEHHHAAIDRLLAAGLAYYCDCARDQVIARTGSEHKGYDGYCRDRGLSAGEGRAVRFRTPDEGSTVIVDLVRGTPTFENALIEDFVIARGGGSPVFLLANVVDDLVMKITPSAEHSKLLTRSATMTGQGCSATGVNPVCLPPPSTWQAHTQTAAILTRPATPSPTCMRGSSK